MLFLGVGCLKHFSIDSFPDFDALVKNTGHEKKFVQAWVKFWLYWVRMPRLKMVKDEWTDFQFLVRK